MKKIFRCTAVILAAVLIAFSLCSCRDLDSMREHQAFYNDIRRDYRTEILLGEDVYKKIDLENRVIFFTESSDNSYYVTAKDVPVLLSRTEGNSIKINEDRTIIKETLTHHGSLFGYPIDTTWYVREDLFDKYTAALTDAELDRYYFNCNEYPKSGHLEFNVRQKNVLLDEETTEAVNKLLSVSDKDKVSYKELSDGDYAHKIIYLYRCDKDMLITDRGSGVSVINDNGRYYVCSGRKYDVEKMLCPVPDDDKEKFAELFEDYPDSIETYNFKDNFEPDTSGGEYHDDDVYPAPAVTEAAESNTV